MQLGTVRDVDTSTFTISFSSLTYLFDSDKSNGGFNYDSGGVDSLATKNDSLIVPINFSLKGFKKKPLETFNGRFGYEPMLSFFPDRIDAEGLEFKGSVYLDSEISGYVNSNRPITGESPLFCENFLRIISAYVLLKKNNGLFMHSSAIVVDGEAYMFIGPSNAGKTTTARMAQAYGAKVLSDDANLIHESNNYRFAVDAVPFSGDLGQQTPQAGGPYPLVGIFALEKSEQNKVIELSLSQQIASLLVSSPVVNMDPYRNALLFDRAQNIAETVPVKKLQFTKSFGFNDIYQKILKSLG